MRIHKAARETGLTVDAIRYYGKQGLVEFEPPNQTDSFFAKLPDSCIKRLNQIRVLRKAGFTTKEIKVMLERPDMIPTVLWIYKNRLEEHNDKLKLVELVLNLREDQVSDARSLAKQMAASVREYKVPMDGQRQTAVK